MARAPKGMFLPELVEPNPKEWEVFETTIREAAVDLAHRKAYVPRALTPAQALARLHELGHVKYTPRNWSKHMAAVIAECDDAVDPSVVIEISKMLEENRIDWLLWSRHHIDLRPAREVLDWTKMEVPDQPLRALKWVLQLAWTVWASRGLSSSIPGRPPERESDEETGNFFDACWAVLSRYDASLSVAIVNACLAIYADPTDARRNSVAAELAVFFPPKKEVEEQPPVKEEEQEEQKEAQEKAEAEDESRDREDSDDDKTEETAIHSSSGVLLFDVHDHTKSIKRKTTRINRKMAPAYFGSRLAYPHRYMVDKAVFGRRTVTDGGLMIDGSGSMHWSQADLKMVMEKMPAITTGIYGGFDHGPASGIYGRRPGGRLCILAKGGRADDTFQELEPGFNRGNEVDIEALEILGKWPAPRFFLSDGYVCGGAHRGPHPIGEYLTTPFMMSDGNVVAECEKLMLRYDILRVPDLATLTALFSRRRVTLYRGCRGNDKYATMWFGSGYPLKPISYQL